MNLCPRMLFSFLLLPALVACTKKKDLSPPPLNPHPKEALHVSVTFDRPEDAKRYTIAMRALYQNQQSECGYIASFWIGNFVYPHGTFEIPNESRDPTRAQFTIHLDRYNRETCNWELASPSFRIRDTYTGRQVSGDWGLDEDLAPGTEYKAICPFGMSDYPDSCYGRRPVPDAPYFNKIPASGRIPLTVRVSDDSAPLRPAPPSFFSEENFVKPVRPNTASLPRSTHGSD